MTRLVIAMTGATGFVGQHTLHNLIKAGHHVRALTRRPQKPQDGVEWIYGHLQSNEALYELTRDADIMLHIAGAVRGRTKEDFFRANEEGTIRALMAAKTNEVPHFIHISSLAAREPGLSYYAESKAAAERQVQASKGVNWTIIRPPAVYGAGDKELLPMFKAMSYGLALIPGSNENRFSLIHARDLADCLCALALASHEMSGQVFEVDDGFHGGYKFKDIANAVESHLGKKINPLILPKPLIKSAASISEIWSNLIGNPAMLTRQKANELMHPDWVISGQNRLPADIWKPVISLDKGLKDTLDWYKHQKLI